MDDPKKKELLASVQRKDKHKAELQWFRNWLYGGRIFQMLDKS